MKTVLAVSIALAGAAGIAGAGDKKITAEVVAVDRTAQTVTVRPLGAGGTTTGMHDQHGTSSMGSGMSGSGTSYGTPGTGTSGTSGTSGMTGTTGSSTTGSGTTAMGGTTNDRTGTGTTGSGTKSGDMTGTTTTGTGDKGFGSGRTGAFVSASADGTVTLRWTDQSELSSVNVGDQVQLTCKKGGGDANRTSAGQGAESETWSRLSTGAFADCTTITNIDKIANR